MPFRDLSICSLTSPGSVLEHLLAATTRLGVVTAAAVLIGACSFSEDAMKSKSRPGDTDRASQTGSHGRGRAEESAKPRLRVIGHTDLGGRGFNADVYGFRHFAYVGVWGGVSEPAPCPASGVKVVDIARPSQPEIVSTLQNPEGTSGEDIVVRSVDTRSFSGDLAVVGIQPCGMHPNAFTGLQFFDVTHPPRPKELGRWKAPPGSIGCHEVDLAVNDKGRVLAGCANPLASAQGHNEAVLVDASNPSRPKEIGGWRAPVHWASGVGCLKLSLAHNVRFVQNARRAFVSYWDAGTALLDIKNPRRPRVVGVTRTTPRSKDGDNHSVSVAEGDLLLINLEDFSPASPGATFGGCGGKFGAWGQLYIYDNSNPKRTRFISRYGTPRSKLKRSPRGAVYSIHNSEVVSGDQVFASWFSDGIRWIDISDPRRPFQKARFVPPRSRDPHGVFPSVPLVWGVKPLEEMDLILASDINSGLWILRAEGLGDF